MQPEPSGVRRDPDPAPKRELRHVPGLDGVRGVAVLLVLVTHIQSYLIPGHPSFEFGRLKGAFLGVDLFFVLSGFLITALLLREQRVSSRISFSGFYWRRALRLLPALFVLLAVHGLYARITGLSMHDEWRSARAAMVYLSNWAWKWPSLQLQPGLSHLWSLAIEEQFYLVWPLVMVVLSIRRNVWFVTGAILGGIVLVMANRYRLWDANFPWFYIYVRTDARADTLLVGALAAQLWVRGLVPVRLLRWACWPALAVVALTVTFARADQAYLYLGGFTLFAAAGAVVVLTVVERAWVGNVVLDWSPLRAVGRVSYGLYLWHLPIFDVVNRYGADWGAGGRIVVGLALSAVATVASWRLIEKPILRFKGLFPRRARAAVEQPVPVA